MTVHILVSLIVLVVLLHSLRWLSRGTEGRRPLSWLPLFFAALAILPLCFGPLIPITHYVFEFTPANVWWFVVVFGLLWCVAGSYLWRCRAAVKPAAFALYIVMWLLLGFWYYLGAALSDHEDGDRLHAFKRLHHVTVTPKTTDAPIYVAHWASVQVMLLALLLLLFFSPEYRRGWVRLTASFLLFAVFARLLFEPL